VHHRRALIEASLAAAGERIGDPATLVYAQLFATQPAVAALFCNDRSGAVRGEMLARAFDTLLDFVGDQGFAPHFLRAERDNHAGYGVEPQVFMTFFEVIFVGLAREMADDWSAEVRDAWGEVLAEMRAVMGEEVPAGAQVGITG
jgi:hemoglobin-like flavoprotein